MMVDFDLPFIKEKYQKWRESMNILIVCLRLVHLGAATCIIKRGKWKMGLIDFSRKLVKDEAWKDIHMTVPRNIVKLTIISMSCYIVYQLI